MNKFSAQCRICLELKSDLQTIYTRRDDEYLPHIIWSISGVKILRRVEPEAKICSACIEAVQIALHIIWRCQKTEEYLQSVRIFEANKRQEETLTEENNESLEEEEDVLTEENDETLEEEYVLTEDNNEPLDQEFLTEDNNELFDEEFPTEENNETLEEEFLTEDRNELLEEEEEILAEETNEPLEEILSEDDNEPLNDEVLSEYDNEPLDEEVLTEESNEQLDDMVVEFLEESLEEECTDSTTTPPISTAKRRRSRKRQEPLPHACELCDYQTKVGKQLIAHQEEAHGIKDVNIYKCTMCTQRFSWKPKLYRHIQDDHKTLPEEKKHKCAECGKAYTRERHLTDHIKQSHLPRRFKCAEPNCDRTFGRAFTLRRHYLTAHTNNSRYHCADCDKYFKVYDLWQYHNKVVHNNATVYCPNCGYAFRLKSKLQEHLEKKLCAKSVVPCMYCQRRFTTKSGLRDHLRNIHKITSKDNT